MTPEEIRGKYKKRKSKFERLDEQIGKMEVKRLENPTDQAICDEIVRLKEEQRRLLRRHTQILDEYIRMEKENYYFGEEEL